MRKPKKILIIKTGFSEFLDRDISITVSYGDVLLCTTLLHLFKNDHVTWVTSWIARHLLADNPLIRELLIFGPSAFKKIVNRRYDVLINLEKDIGICTFLRQIKASERYGFYFNERTHDISTFKPSDPYLLTGQEHHKGIHQNTLEILYKTLGRTWAGQSPILIRKRKSKEIYDIGLNYAVGSKWPTKMWPMYQWKKLQRLLSGNFNVSWQQGFSNIKKYIDWIDSCRLIVTSDSLGQIIGQALGKKVITLFGPTNSKRMQDIPHITVIKSPLKCPHMPCYLSLCKNKKFCMDYLSPESVARLCQKILRA